MRAESNEANVNSALTSLIQSGPSPGWQSLVDALRAELDATAVELKTNRQGPAASAGEIPDSSPSLVILSAGGRAYGTMAIWLPHAAVPSDSARNRLEFVASMIALILECDGSRREFEEFIQAVTHDVRGVLVRANSLAQLLGRLGQFTAEGEQVQSYLTQNLGAGESLLRELAAYAKAGASTERAEVVTVRSLLEALRWQVKPELSKKGATLHISESDRELCVREKEMTEALRRVVENSIKYGALQITLEAVESDGGTLLSVNDDGPGIEPSYAESVFEPMRRLQGSEIPGHGLGLPIARRIVERNGGAIWVEQRTGPGASVRVWLPEPSADLVKAP
jgi:signal transduction histidine kinase